MQEAIRAALREAAAAGTGPLGLAFHDFTTGETVLHNGDRPFPMASVYKIFTLCELFRQQKEGLLSLEDRHVLLEREKRPGSGVLELVGEGAVFSLADLAALMIAISDNTSAGILTDLVTRERIRRNILEPLGLRETKIDLEEGILPTYYGVDVDTYRRICDSGGRFFCRDGDYFACRTERNVQTSPRDLLKLLCLLHDGKLIDPATDRAILDVMTRCRSTARIPAHLPAGTKTAHKTGSVDHVANDAGIVFSHRGDYALALFYNGNLASEEEYNGTSWSDAGDRILARLSGRIWDAYANRG